jgi:single-strand DNA-binding protein
MSTEVKNRVQLIGNLGKAPEIKVFDNNKLAKFSVATSEYKKNKNGEVITDTQWHYVSAWGKLADLAQKTLDKGNKVSIEGKLQNRSYTDKEGNKRYTTEIVASEIVLLSTKEELAA